MGWPAGRGSYVAGVAGRHVEKNGFWNVRNVIMVVDGELGQRQFGESASCQLGADVLV